MNEYDAPRLFYLVALLISLARTRKRWRTFLYSIAAQMVVGFAVLLTLIFFPGESLKALGHLAGDSGRLAGAIVAFFYSTKNRDRAPKSIYLVALSWTIILLFWLGL